MHDDPRVEFLDSDEEIDGVRWRGEEGINSHQSARLPAHTTARRVIWSVVVFALGVSLTGFLGRAAYRHDQQVAVAAKSLVLGEAGSGQGLTLTVSGSAGDAGVWRLEPTATMSIEVTNKSPDAITLLPGATMTGRGLTRPAVLGLSGTALLQPGQSGRLTGPVTVNCGVGTQSRAQGADSTDTTQPAPEILSVHARPASGTVAATSVRIGSYGEAMRDQVCREQGDAVTTGFPESADLTHHSVTVTVSARSRSAQALDYALLAGYSVGGETTPGDFSPELTVTLLDGVPALNAIPAAAAEAAVPGARLTEVSVAGPVNGTLDPNSGLRATFTVHVESCPSQVPASVADSLQFVVFLDDQGQPAYFEAYHVGLGDLVAKACGLPAPAGA